MSIGNIRMFVGAIFFALAGFIPGLRLGTAAGWDAHDGTIAWYVSAPDLVLVILLLVSLGMAALLIIPEMHRR